MSVYVLRLCNKENVFSRVLSCRCLTRLFIRFERLICYRVDIFKCLNWYIFMRHRPGRGGGAILCGLCFFVHIADKFKFCFCGQQRHDPIQHNPQFEIIDDGVFSSKHRVIAGFGNGARIRATIAQFCA